MTTTIDREKIDKVKDEIYHIDSSISTYQIQVDFLIKEINKLEKSKWEKLSKLLDEVT